LLVIMLSLGAGMRSVAAIDCSEGNINNLAIEQLEICKNESQKELDMSLAATAPLETEIKKLGARIAALQKGINTALAKLKTTEIGIKERSEKVSTQYLVLAVKIRGMYIRLRSEPLWVSLLSSSSMGEARRELAYRQESNDKDKQVIVSLVQEIGQLEEDKKTLEKQKEQLSKLQAELDKQNLFFQAEVKKAKAYQSDLSGKIAQLSSKQQQLLAEKLGSLNLPTSLGGGALSCTDDRKLDPGFSNAYAFFTYGIPHRVGMDQYGAYGRAKEGQTYDQILKSYFNFDDYRDEGNRTIKVNNSNEIGKGSIVWTGSLEEYIKRIYEIPSSWPSAALEAQAIAARSYALAVTNNGEQSICANQHCQVFKAEPKGGDWDSAVGRTTGKVMVVDGKAITAWYASTAGGYTFTNSDIWGGSQRSWTKRLRDTHGDVGGWGDLQSKAYDRDSPCFYAAQGWRTQYNKSAWLKSEEVADIVNVLLLAQRDSSTQNHLSQIDKPNPDGTDTWDMEKVKSELRNKGGKSFNSISNVSVSADFGIGKTANVMVSGDAGSQTFSANDFINYFNLRAPANIQIVGPLFNIEKK